MKARQLMCAVAAIAFMACEDEAPTDTACAGYLGCSAGQQIGPPEDEPTVAVVEAPGVPAVGVNAVLPGAGCGKPLPADTPPTIAGTPQGYKQYTVMGTGVTLAATIPAKAGPRTFWVRVPPDYDPLRAYRVVYIGQGCGAFGVANTATWPLYDERLGGTEQAIYVALDIPQDGVNMNCYDDRDGTASQEWQAFELFHSVVDANYCVDNNRVYVAGYDTGGWLANMWGCYFAGDGEHPAGEPGPRRFAPRFHIRGQAGLAGGEPPDLPACNGPVAAIFIHDVNDPVAPISGALDALARVGTMNGCDTIYDPTAIVTTTVPLNPAFTNQVPWHPEVPLLEGCVKFTGCPRDYPVVFCTTEGLGHSAQTERATAAYDTFFNELSPQTPPTE
jgi:poly(3-hydroxybutyrate) depolymerase